MPEGLINTLGLVAVALINLAGIYYSRQKLELIIEEGKKTQENVILIEKATNSMKDALVKSTGDASFAEGKEEARVEAETKAANVLASVKAEESAKAEGKAEAVLEGSKS